MPPVALCSKTSCVVCLWPKYGQYSDWATGSSIWVSNPGGVRDHPNRILGPPSLPFNAYRVSLPAEEYICRSMNVTTLSSSIEVRNEWSYTSTPSPCLHGVDRGTCILFLEDKATWFPSMTNKRRKCLQNVKERVSSYTIRGGLGRM
jgi:hypothetical protein